MQKTVFITYISNNLYFFWFSWWKQSPEDLCAIITRAEAEQWLCACALLTRRDPRICACRRETRIKNCNICLHISGKLRCRRMRAAITSPASRSARTRLEFMRLDLQRSAAASSGPAAASSGPAESWVTGDKHRPTAPRSPTRIDPRASGCFPSRTASEPRISPAEPVRSSPQRARDPAARNHCTSPEPFCSR